MEEAPDPAGQRPAYEFAEEAHCATLVFALAQGRSVSFRYQDLREVRYDHAGAVRLRFAAARVVVSGRNLLALWRALRSRSVRLVRAGSEAEGLRRADYEPHIDGIAITPAPRRDT